MTRLSAFLLHRRAGVRKDPAPYTYTQTVKTLLLSSQRSKDMTTSREGLLLLVLSIGLMACGTSGSARDASSRDAVTGNRIVVEDLSMSVSGLSAYQVVSQYRSSWLRKRGAMSINNPAEIKVYLDGSGSPYGTVESLRNIPATDVASIQHFDASAAQFRFGLGNVAGALLVTTKNGS